MYNRDKKHTTHSHGSSKLTSRRELRKRSVDGKAIKRSGQNLSRNRSSERSAKEARLLTEAPKDTKTKDDGKPKRYNELSPLMTKMTEDELKNIMINVWQALPVTANSEAEKMVLEKLKGEAGDNLRNTIGLNVTNRLINIHNGILVKIIIFSAVTPSEIYSFSKKFNIQELKNVQSRTYAGRMLTWTDLDALVTRKDLRCGKSRVSITPIYNFLKCPPSLRTVFDGSQDYSKAKAIEKEIAMKMKKLEGKPVLTADKVLAEHAKNDAARNTKTDDAKHADSKISKETIESQKDKAPDSKSSNEKTSDDKGSSKDNDSKNKVSETKNAVSATNNKNPKVVPGANSKVGIIKKIESKPENKPESENKITKTIAAAKNVKPADKPTTTVNQKSAPAAKIAPKPSEVIAKVDLTKVDKQTDTVKTTKTETQPTKVAPAKTIVNKQPVANNPSKVADNTKNVVNTPAKVATTPKAATGPKVTTAPKVTTDPNATTTPKVASAPKVATTPKTPTTAKTVTTVKKETEAPKSNEKKPEVTTKAEPSKAPIKDVTKTVTKPDKPNSAKNETVPKPLTLPTKVEPKPLAKVINKQDNTPKKEVKSIPAEIKKPNTKLLPKSAKSPKSLKVDAKSKRNESDFDELSDHDILKMLSSGIVLDECSGSEED